MDYIPASSTSVILPVYIQDLTSNIGEGLTGLTPASTNLVCYYQHNNDGGPTQVLLNNMTVGTYTASGFVACSNTQVPGDYQLCLPDAAWIPSGALYVTITLRGANNMLPVKQKFQFTNAPFGFVPNNGINRNSFVNVPELTSAPTWPINPYDIYSWMMMRALNRTDTTVNVSGSGGMDIIFNSSLNAIASGLYTDTGVVFTRSGYK